MTVERGGTDSAQSMSLRDFVRTRPTSARLRNAFEAAALEGRIPIATVGDYLASPEPGRVLCAAVRNFGRGSADELDRLIRHHRAGGVATADAADGEQPAENEVRRALLSLEDRLRATSLRELLRDVSRTSRLARVLVAVGDHPAWDVVVGLEAMSTRLLLLDGVGGTTLGELGREVPLAVSRVLEGLGVRPGVRATAMSRLFDAADLTGTSSPQAGPNAAIASQVRAVLDGLLVREAFRGVVTSARLTRLFQNPEVADRPLADVLLDPSGFEATSRQMRAIGRRTIDEFWQVCWRTLGARLERAGVGGERRERLATALGIDADSLSGSSGRRSSDAGSFSKVGDGPGGVEVVPLDLDALLDWLLGRIRDQDAYVVRRRFGLDRARDDTLEEIGTDLSLTRERVRQIEKRGLKDLRVLSKVVDLRRAVDAEGRPAWSAVAGEGSVLTDAAFAKQRRRLPGRVRLALELLKINDARWLGVVSARFPRGWLAPFVERGRVQAVAEALGARSLVAPLPRAVRSLELPGDDAEAEAALLLSGRQVLWGYLVEGRTGPRPRRTLAAHVVLSQYGRPVAIAELLHAYQRRIPRDPCSPRDLMIVMEEAPHLFLEISEDEWRALGAVGRLPSETADATFEADEGDDPARAAAVEQDQTVAASIREELGRSGPLSLGPLVENARRFLPRGRSPNSIQPTLLTRSDVFARLLPGIYALLSQVPSREQVLHGEVPYLLDERQARMFAMARRAGEPWGTFPLWSPEAEYRLCRWARTSASSEVWRSLLATATVSAWPVDDAQRAVWRDRVLADGRYDLVDALRPNFCQNRPSLDRVLAALIHLQRAGEINWIALNRVEGRPVASHAGSALLATLVMLGAVDGVDDGAESPWQLPHRMRSAETAGLVDLLVAEMHATGRLDWTSTVGRELALAIVAAEARAPRWLPFHRFSGLFGSLVEGDQEPIDVTTGDVTAVGGRLLAERRMVNLVEWLDAQ